MYETLVATIEWRTDAWYDALAWECDWWLDRWFVTRGD